MNRDIEFRGRTVILEWQYGFYTMIGNKHYICTPKGKNGVVRYCIDDANTIGQYTGLKDKNGKKIFERDIVIAHGTKFIIKFGPYRTQLFEKEYGSAIHTKQFGWYAESIENKTQCNLVVPNDIEVIGNIYENKELLEG